MKVLIRIGPKGRSHLNPTNLVVINIIEKEITFLVGKFNIFVSSFCATLGGVSDANNFSNTLLMVFCNGMFANK